MSSIVRCFNHLFVFMLLILVPDLSQAQLTEWDVADANVVRYSPDSFPDLPAAIRKYLKSEGYTIPQSFLNIGKHNVISGNFRSKDKTDWAVLASKNRESAILIFWDGSFRKVSVIAKEPDKSYLQEIGDKVITYARYIEVINREETLEYVRRGKADEHIIKQHDGIHDRFLDKASSVHYYSADQWHRFIGSD
jgi:hypothetical protein